MSDPSGDPSTVMPVEPPAPEPPEPAPATPRCEGPPPSARPAEPLTDPRAQLLRMAAALTRTCNDRLLVEYLRLRRVAS